MSRLWTAGLTGVEASGGLPFVIDCEGVVYEAEVA
jgi:hypothetical protein